MLENCSASGYERNSDTALLLVLASQIEAFSSSWDEAGFFEEIL
jgi:hypothetical protein